MTGTDVKENYVSVFDTYSKHLDYEYVHTCVNILANIIEGDISFKELYFPEFTYPVSAGLAPFNITYTENITPEWGTAMCVPDPEMSSLTSFFIPTLPQGLGRCVSSDTLEPEWVPCDSAYFLAGGILAVAPQPNYTEDAYPDSPAVVVPNTQGYHVEFGQVRDLQALRNGTGLCAAVGDDGGAVFWCMQQPGANSYLAGQSRCLHLIMAVN